MTYFYFPLWLNNMPLYIDTKFSLPISPLMDSEADSTAWLLPSAAVNMGLLQVLLLYADLTFLWKYNHGIFFLLIAFILLDI